MRDWDAHRTTILFFCTTIALTLLEMNREVELKTSKSCPWYGLYPWIFHNSASTNPTSCNMLSSKKSPKIYWPSLWIHYQSLQNFVTMHCITCYLMFIYPTYVFSRTVSPLSSSKIMHSSATILHSDDTIKSQKSCCPSLTHIWSTQKSASVG